MRGREGKQSIGLAWTKEEEEEPKESVDWKLGKKGKSASMWAGQKARKEAEKQGRVTRRGKTP